MIIKAEHNDKVPNRRFVVTNKVGTQEALYDFYTMRGDCENLRGRSKSVPGGGRKVYTPSVARTPILPGAVSVAGEVCSKTPPD